MTPVESCHPKIIYFSLICSNFNEIMLKLAICLIALHCSGQTFTVFSNERNLRWNLTGMQLLGASWGYKIARGYVNIHLESHKMTQLFKFLAKF